MGPVVSISIPSPTHANDVPEDPQSTPISHPQLEAATHSPLGMAWVCESVMDPETHFRVRHCLPTTLRACSSDLVKRQSSKVVAVQVKGQTLYFGCPESALGSLEADVQQAHLQGSDNTDGEIKGPSLEVLEMSLLPQTCHSHLCLDLYA